MVTINIATSDCVVWQRDSVLLEFIQAVNTRQPVTLDFMLEGPDVNELNIIDTLVSICKTHDYDIKQVVVKVANVVQNNLPFEITHIAPWHFVSNTKKHASTFIKQFNSEFKTFGMFIGRSNLYRLQLASYLYNRYPTITIQTFHYDPTIDFHRNNLGIENLISNTNNTDITNVAEFLKQCPIKGPDNPPYPIALDNHCDISGRYANFFVEIVCESYFTGNTFFPTEKTWRAIVNRTPFIIQGAQKYLHRLRNMGFKTFSSYWDEGYAEDPSNYQTQEIIKVIDDLSRLNTDQLANMYQDMQDVLEHNYNRFFELTQEDFNNVK